MVAGTAELTSERLIWRPSNNNNNDNNNKNNKGNGGNGGAGGGGSALTGRSVPLTVVTGHQRNKPGRRRRAFARARRR